MDPFRLAEIAARAEILRLRAYAKRQGARVALVAVATVFLLAALVAAHVAAAMALTAWAPPVFAVLIVAGIDLLLALVVLLQARRDRPGAAEREALALRRAVRGQLLTEALVTALSSVLRRRGR